MLEPTRVLIADDSVVFRSFIRRCLQDIPNVEVAGVARDGNDALDKVAALKPDLLTLDMEMPGMHGIEVLKNIHDRFPDLKVIIIASETSSSATLTLQALDLGAFDFILKPRAEEKDPQGMLTGLLRSKIGNAGSVADINRRRHRRGVPTPPAAIHQVPREVPVRPRPKGVMPGAIDLLAIGSSTGGPTALHHVIDRLPASLPVPVVITQHMPALFLASLAQRLNESSELQCQVAEEGMQLRRGNVYIAPGDRHMLIEKSGLGLTVRLDDGPKVHHCKPAVDPMFSSIARLAPSVRALAVVLTGMGEDGAEGARLIGEGRGYVIAQDQATSVVWGMPGATVRLGAANEVLPLDEISQAVVQYCMPVSRRA